MNMVTDSADSILAAVAGVLVPVFRPLGMGDWRICTFPDQRFYCKKRVWYLRWKCCLLEVSVR